MRVLQAKGICFSLCLLITSIFIQNAAVYAQSAVDNSGKPAIWEKISEEGLAARGQRNLKPEKYSVFRLNQSELSKTLEVAPLEFTTASRSSEVYLTIPKPDGKLVRFRLEESPIFAPNVAAQFPTWKTYQGFGVDEPGTYARFDWTDSGFHGYVFAHEGTFSIDPYQTNDRENYIVFYKNDYGRTTRDFHCKMDELLSEDKSLVDSFIHPTSSLAEFTHGTTVRTYRLAIATTFEYTSFFRQAGDSDSQAQTRAFNAVTTSVNRITGVYRKEMAVSFTLVSSTNLTYVVNPETPADYANNGSSADLNQNQTNVDSVLGSANYDMAHLFETTDSGVAQLQSVCATGSKARGLSGQPAPQGDPFDVDYVAHEMGHQFAANHTFNAAANCGSSPTAARKEPGSAVTIMGYAGICSSTSNVARNSIETFHVYNLTEIINFITTGGGASCGTTAGTNTAPVITPLSNYTIPFNTPFALTASATDADSDPITYNWEQNDSGASQASYPGTTDDDDTSLVFRPGFRSYLPQTTGTRSFPSLPYILNNSNEAPITFTGTSPMGAICAGTCITGEDLPSAARTMNFRVSVRDNRGGISDAGTVLTVINTTTPFKVTSQNSSPATWAGGSTQTVTWDVSGTNAGSINAANVKISISTDGGQTFPNVVAASTPNDGTQTITVPTTGTTQARIKVEAVGNIFFDINDANFTITAAPTASNNLFDFDGDGKDDVSVYRGGTWYLLNSLTGFSSVSFGLATDRTVAGDYDGDNKTDVAVFRNGAWIVLNSATNAVSITNFGTTGDIPMVGDYDGDNKSDYAVFRAGNWYILGSTAGFSSVAFGTTGDVPVPADFDGDGRTDVAVFRAGNWYILGSTAGFSAVGFGLSTDVPAPADFDGDNKTDVAVFRNGNWYILNSTTGFSAVAFGTTGDKPIPAQAQ